jgi:RNA polymerase sigma-70 factor (ECF subfamily)
MVVLQGLSYEEVAQVTGCAVGTAKSRVFRARGQVQAWLTGEERSERQEVRAQRSDTVHKRTAANIRAIW